jgi:hypothetical protein
MQGHEPTQTNQPAVSVRRVAVIRTHGRRFHVYPTTQLQENPMQLFTGPTLNLNKFPALNYPSTDAHGDDSYRDTRGRYTNELRVREELSRARQPSVSHRRRSTPTTDH